MNFLFIKNLTLSLLLIGMSKLIAQPFVSIDNATISVAPSYTFAHGTNYTVSGSVVNSGTVAINSNVHVHLAIDTSSTVGVNKFYTRSSGTFPMFGFMPNATFTFSIGDGADQANSYKVAGNGITIVVWASAGPNPNDITTTKDSVYSHIYLLPPLMSLQDETSFEANPLHIQNPATSVINFEFLVPIASGINNGHITVELINANGKMIENIQHSTFNIQHLTQGIYYLRFYNKQTHKILTKKIIIN